LPADFVDHLDKIAEVATDELGCDVKRATVMRAAFSMWFASINGDSLQPIVSALRAATVKRGRKPKPPPPPYSAPASPERAGAAEYFLEGTPAFVHAAKLWV